MKRFFLKAFTVFLIMGWMTSCSEQEIIPDELLIDIEQQACCETGELDPPPPPPPPPPGGGSGG